MKLFWRFIRTDVKKSKRNFVLFGCTIFLGVIAIVISLLLTRTGKLLYADTLLSDYGNYDVAFCQVSDKLKDVIEKDNRFSELGYVFDQESIAFWKPEIVLKLVRLRIKKQRICIMLIR